MSEVIDYTPPPTIREFVKDYRPSELFYDWIIGPVGSGKTTGVFFKLCHMASMQAPDKRGVRRSRAVVVRNTMPQLKDTTLVSWNYWFKDGQAGDWRATEKVFILRFGDVECEVLFRPLDTEDDVQRVLSLEVTFAIIDEFVQIPKKIIDALSARLGRYPSKKDGGATNWGMWGASNPSTEDNWWFDYLHNEAVVERININEDLHVRRARRALLGYDNTNVRYFVQPSGYSPDAENLENLPGMAEYYTNQAKGKSLAWIKQFLEAEWGFSISGTPVVPTYKPNLHNYNIIKSNPRLQLGVGFDPGLAGSAFVFGQEDLHGRLLVLGELVQQGFGAERLIVERLKPYLRRRFPDHHVVILPDPAAANRSSNDEKTIVDTFKKHFDVKYEENNRLPLRLEAIEHFTTRLVDVGAALAVDTSECPMLIRALKGGWRYEIDNKRDIVKRAEPEKNQWSHVGDAFGYLCRFYHKLNQREMRYSGQGGGKRFTPPRSFGPSYHMR